MKTKILFSILLIILVTSLITVMGQEKTDQKKQEEAAKKKKEPVTIIVDKQKDSQKDLQKAMEESLADEEKALKAKKESGMLNNKEFVEQTEALQDYKKKLEEMKFNYSEDWQTLPQFNAAPHMKFQFAEPGYPNVYEIYSGSRENTSLSISKTLEDVTFSTDFYYDVKNESSNVSFYVTGSLKAGELKITLKKPDKTAFQEITISPLADVNWNQKFTWDEGETEEYLGKWTIAITAAKATGTYRVQVNSR